MPESNIPVSRFENLFLDDPTGRRLWKSWLGSERYADVKGHLSALGEAGARAEPLSRRADKQGPVLETHGPDGERIDRVVQHPDYHELERLSYGRGIIGIKYDPKFLAKNRAFRHLVGFAGSYYFGQTEMGLFCPICMTDGVGRVLERHAADVPIARETIAHLSSTETRELWQGAMFLTERQGGSDVGTNVLEARRKGDRWFLYGDKWFCSNVAADAILALARMPDGPQGTRGLGLFLVLRQRPEGNARAIRIHRLKDKLGVRSMPTGEVTFEGVEATLIGGAGEGFKQMAEMLNMSRLYNAVASVGALRRAILEAYAYGQGRKAFGFALTELPLWRATMADLAAEHLGMLSLVFETVRSLDAADCGDAEAALLARLTTPMAKALAGKLAMWGVSEAMEAIGGNAYIEENILPRLLRDAQVLPIWEGTTHVLTLDAQRAIEKEGAYQALIARVERARAKAAGPFAEGARIVGERLAADQKALLKLADLPLEQRARASRQWLETAGRTLTLAFLAEQVAYAPLAETSRAAFLRVSKRPYGVMPVCHEAASLVETEAPLLASIRGTH